MDRLDLKVQDETIFSVLRFIINERNVSRAEIAKACNVSEVTVGKVIDFFFDKSLIVKWMIREKTSSGPRPYRTHMNSKYNCAILDMLTAETKISLINVEGRVLESENHKPRRNNPQPFDITLFLKSFREKCWYDDEGFRFGASLVLPMFSENVNDQKYDELITSLTNDFKARRVCCDTPLGYAKEEITRHREYENMHILYILFNYSEIFAVMFPTEDSELCSHELNLYKEFAKRNGPDETVRIISEYLYKRITSTNIDRIIIDTTQYRTLKGFLSLTMKYLTEKLGIPKKSIPVISITNKKALPFVYRGAMTRLQNMLVDDIIVKLSSSK